MAHGASRICICHKCKQYTLVPRFSDDPECSNCGEITEQTTKEKIREKYKLSLFFYNFMLNFGYWEQINEKDEIR